MRVKAIAQAEAIQVPIGIYGIQLAPSIEWPVVTTSSRPDPPPPPRQRRSNRRGPPQKIAGAISETPSGQLAAQLAVARDYIHMCGGVASAVLRRPSSFLGRAVACPCLGRGCGPSSAAPAVAAPRLRVVVGGGVVCRASHRAKRSSAAATPIATGDAAASRQRGGRSRRRRGAGARRRRCRRRGVVATDDGYHRLSLAGSSASASAFASASASASASGRAIRPRRAQVR